MFSRDHIKISNKVSAKLYRMISQGVAHAGLLHEIPQDYYPRLNSEHGLDFFVAYVRNFSDVPLVPLFIERGMDINVPIDSEGNTLLHHLMRKPARWWYVIDRLSACTDQIDFSRTNHDGDMPLDLLGISGGITYGTVYAMLMGEANALYGKDETSRARKDYLRTRAVSFLEYMDGDELELLIPSQIPLDHRNADGKTMFMLLLENCGDVNSLRALVEREMGAIPDRKEPVLNVLVERFNAQAQEVIALLCEEHALPVHADAVALALTRKCLDLAAYLYGRLDPCADDAVRRRLFEAVLKTADTEYVLEAAKNPMFAGSADIDAPVLEDGMTLLSYVLARGDARSADILLAAGADIRAPDGNGEITRKAATKHTRALVDEHLRRVNTSGRFERVHDSQVACKNGVLTYIFDFYAGQVVVRDAKTKNIAATSFAEFARSGAPVLDAAARALADLGGDVGGFSMPVGSVGGAPALVRKQPPAVGKKAPG